MAGASKLGLVVLLASGCITFDPIGADQDKPPTVPDAGGDGPGSRLEARRAFTKQVHPILAAQCGACHAAGGNASPWFREDPELAYLTLTTTYAGLLGQPMFSPDAPLVTAPERTSQGFYLPEQLDLVFYWFGLEVL